MECEDCQRYLQASLKSTRPKALAEAIQKKGLPIDAACADCSREGIEGMARAFLSNPPPEITLCANRLNSGKDVEEALTHELIHAYDFCTREMDLTQGEILACSEIRAARESECFGRNMPFCCRDLSEVGLVKDLCQWWHRRCVRSHAIGATQSIFPKEAASLVDKVFPQCYMDRSPFQSTDNVAFDNTRKPEPPPEAQ